MEKIKEKNKRLKIGTIICIIILIIMLPILFISSWMLTMSIAYPDQIPNFMGYKPFIVLSGSMEPTIKVGDLAISRTINTDELKVGDIISYRYNEDTVITHRIVKIISKDGDTEYIVQGDNNYSVDTLPVKRSQIEGKYLFKIDNAGNIAMFIQKPIGFITVASIPIIIIIIEQIKILNEYKKEVEELKRKSDK